jgi:hypothetical protein
MVTWVPKDIARITRVPKDIAMITWVPKDIARVCNTGSKKRYC